MDCAYAYYFIAINSLGIMVGVFGFVTIKRFLHNRWLSLIVIEGVVIFAISCYEHLCALIVKHAKLIIVLRDQVF